MSFEMMLALLHSQTRKAINAQLAREEKKANEKIKSTKEGVPRPDSP